MRRRSCVGGSLQRGGICHTPHHWTDGFAARRLRTDEIEIGNRLVIIHEVQPVIRPRQRPIGQDDSQSPPQRRRAAPRPFIRALGELRPDGGVLPLLLAVGQGIAQGVATTIHAPSAADVVARLRTYAAFEAQRVPEPAVLETIASTIDLIVHVASVDGQRLVTSVREVGEVREGRVTSAELWRWGPRTGRAVRTDLDFSEPLAAKLRSAGVDPMVIDPRRRTRAAW